MFKKRENVLEIEEGNLLSPKFDNDGLIPVITMCSQTKEILMHGYMNVEALKLTTTDMMVTQKGVPYPIVVPGFPIITTDDRLDYGSKLN